MPTLILLNKPYRVLSQFSPEKSQSKSPEKTLQKEPKETLANYIQQRNVYPAGRLDYDSEGLLLLTDDGALQQHISHPQYKLPKTYWVQVEGENNEEAIKALRSGVELKDGLSKSAIVEPIAEPTLWPRNPPVRFRQSIPTHWLSITISEGRNRQIRRMTATVGLPTLRLIRTSIGEWALEGLQPGEYRSITVPAPSTPSKPFSKPSNKPKPRHIRKNAYNTSTKDKKGEHKR